MYINPLLITRKTTTSPIIRLSMHKEYVEIQIITNVIALVLVRVHRHILIAGRS